MVIGIDIGCTTTKAVAAENSKIIGTVKTKAYDAITSASGALGKIIMENNIDISQIKKLIITGAGSVKIKRNIFGIETYKIDEISSIGLGGMYLAGREGIVITNIGTGTSIIEADKDKITHLGGTGIGGGTIVGLAKELIKSTTFDHILNLAEHGDITNVDLLIEDISDSGISFLNNKTTASNFGKMLDSANREDMAIGILNMVYQVIGMISVFAAKSRNTNNIVITGNGSKNPVGKKILEEISAIYNIGFEFPSNAEYATAIGAALSKEDLHKSVEKE